MPDLSNGSSVRTPAQIEEHYKVEKELANRLRNARKEERLILYNELYDELYLRVPHHPRWDTKNNPELRKKAVSFEFNLLKRFLNNGSVFLEIGPGDCHLSSEVARIVKKVYAVDVSATAMSQAEKKHNLELVISDGCSIPVPENSVDIAYSNQLMEHLHPEDAMEQLRNISDSLNQKGLYICRTPNRLYGPSDISGYFDEVATGFHLHEYTNIELENLFKRTGFSKIKTILRIKKRFFLLPTEPAKLLEEMLFRIPRSKSKVIANNPIVKKLLGVFLIAYKSS